MNILSKLTLHNLKLNKKRTIVTIIGIILATSLICGVSTLVSSFRETLIQAERTQGGDYHYLFRKVPYNEAKALKNNVNFESMYYIKDMGYSMLEASKNQSKPYLHLYSFNDRALINGGIKLKSGRLPQNENEIVIASHIKTNAYVDYNIGDKITLNVSKRVDLTGEYELDQTAFYSKEDEKLDYLYTKEYEIVGIIQRPDYSFEKYSSPGYTVITYLDENKMDGNVDVYLRLTKKGVKKQYSIMSGILGIQEDTIRYIDGSLDIEYDENYTEKCQKYIKDLQNAKYDFDKNTSLLRFENFELDNGTLNMLYGTAIVIIVIIIVTSVFCIRNSFAISITEKMKQYGMLASIGATPKQIRKNVLYEGFILGIIGIPLGILGGLFAIFILLQVVQAILNDYISELGGIKYSVSILFIIVSVILSAITIYLSAISSARRAAKVSPIEAIRNNSDIKINKKKIKTPKFIQKAFGVGGVIADKNLKRNKKKYRTTVISIVVSISIFIAMSTFINYAFDMSSIYTGDRQYNLTINSSEDKIEEIDNAIKNLSGIEKYSIRRDYFVSTYTDELKLNNNSIDFDYSKDENGEKVTFINVVALGDREYRRYIEELNLKYDDVKDKAIIIDNFSTYQANEKGETQYIVGRYYSYKKGDTISIMYRTIDDDIDLTQNLEIVTTTDKRPLGLGMENNSSGYIILSDEKYDELFNTDSDYIYDTAKVFIEASDADETQKDLISALGEDISITNYNDTVREEKAMYLVISIFLYGFMTIIALIGVTNIFNTITTSMDLRSREFAMLKSIGMTNKEFNRMIRFESVLYGTKSLLIGIPLGVLFSYIIYKVLGISSTMTFNVPILSIIISIMAVFILIGCIMKYSLGKINRQNIIETIRKDNI